MYSLAESSTVHITDSDNAWERHDADEYSMKWRFAENEMLPDDQSEKEFDLTLLAIPKRRATSRRGYPVRY
jgi:hypothetical protein